MEPIVLRKHNNVYFSISSTDDIAKELNDHFSFEVEGFRFRKKNSKFLSHWDGKIRCFDLRTQLLYFGLFDQFKKFCDHFQYDYVLEDPADFASDPLSLEDATEFIDDLNIPEITVRGYQLAAFIKGARNKRLLIVSPTGSGKSLNIYLFTKYFDEKTIIIVPTINLVDQLYQDFIDYGCPESLLHKVYYGQDKERYDKPIVITTWQSAYEMPLEWLEQFLVVIGDEAHLFAAKSIKSLMNNLANCTVRIGLTGTVDESKTNTMMLIGLFGPLYQPVTTKELVDRGTLARPMIKALVLVHPKKKHFEYSDEIESISTDPSRNKFIASLALSLKENTTILFSLREQGRLLVEAINSKKHKKDVFYIDGTISPEERTRIKQYAKTHTNCIIVGSYKTFGFGVNIPNLKNLILAAPTKSQNKLLQAIGRGLRKTELKDNCVIFDIADNFQQDKPNMTLKHFHDRVEIYNKEQFQYRMYNINLQDS